jgi:hypothetical protein
MTKIKRNSKKSKKEEREETPQEEQIADDRSDVSIGRRLEEDGLQQYKQYVRGAVREISEHLKKIEQGFP